MKRIIKTKRLILRPLKTGDEKRLVKYLNKNKKIYLPTLTIPYPYSMKDARDWIHKNKKEMEKSHPQMMNFAIEIDGELVGGIGFNSISEKHKAELGYWLAEEYWGKGIMPEAVKAFTKFGFEELDLRRVYAEIFSFNKQSMSVLKKAGYTFEGIMRKNVKKEGKFIDTHHFAKIR